MPVQRRYAIQFHKCEADYVHLYIKPDADLILYFLSETAPVLGLLNGKTTATQKPFVWNVYMAVDLPRDHAELYALTFYSRGAGLEPNARTYTDLVFPLADLCAQAQMTAPPCAFTKSRVPAMRVYDPASNTYVGACRMFDSQALRNVCESACKNF